jgi:hypothetical protein
VTHLKRRAVFKLVRQVRDQSLAIKKGAVGATQVLNEVQIAHPEDPAMTPGDTPFEPPVLCEINIRKYPLCRIQSADLNGLLSWERHLSMRGYNLYVHDTNPGIALFPSRFGFPWTGFLGGRVQS